MDAPHAGIQGTQQKKEAPKSKKKNQNQNQTPPRAPTFEEKLIHKENKKGAASRLVPIYRDHAFPWAPDRFLQGTKEAGSARRSSNHQKDWGEPRHQARQKVDIGSALESCETGYRNRRVLVRFGDRWRCGPVRKERITVHPEDSSRCDGDIERG